MWSIREACRDIINACWREGANLDTLGGIAKGLKQCVANLTRWNMSVFGLIPKQIQKKRRALSELVVQNRDGSRGNEVNKLRKEINELLDNEEIMWHHKAKTQWLGFGDRNTKYFHSMASERRKKNTIFGLCDEEGRYCETTEDIANIVVSYFEKLCTTSLPTWIAEVTNSIPTRVTEEMNQSLIREFTKEEVEAALHQMHPTIALGPDGMLAIFYQKYWDIVGNDVTSMVLNVLNSNLSMAKIKRTNITLVPKTKNPIRMTEFRLIILSNVIYELISKVLANRLKTILPQIILEIQSVFLSECLISDNVLVAFELTHYLDHKRDGKDYNMTVKLDMSKACDGVERGFIEKIMEHMGFHERWINLIMHCITTMTYSILINGVAHGSIILTRGLQQGDPLSSYLFLLCANGFSSLINKAARNKMLNGVSICKGCPMVTHLFFANDSLLFCKAGRQECQKIVEIHELYKVSYGQKINADKSSVFFSHNTPNDTRSEVLEILGPM